LLLRTALNVLISYKYKRITYIIKICIYSRYLSLVSKTYRMKYSINILFYSIFLKMRFRISRDARTSPTSATNKTCNCVMCS